MFVRILYQDQSTQEILVPIIRISNCGLGITDHKNQQEREFTDTSNCSIGNSQAV